MIRSNEDSPSVSTTTGVWKKEKYTHASLFSNLQYLQLSIFKHPTLMIMFVLMDKRTVTLKFSYTMAVTSFLELSAVPYLFRNVVLWAFPVIYSHSRWHVNLTLWIIKGVRHNGRLSLLLLSTFVGHVLEWDDMIGQSSNCEFNVVLYSSQWLYSVILLRTKHPLVHIYSPVRRALNKVFFL